MIRKMSSGALDLAWREVTNVGQLSWCVLAWECACAARYHWEHRRHSGTDRVDKIEEIASAYEWRDLVREDVIIGLRRVESYQALLALAEHERDLMLRAEKKQVIAIICAEDPSKQARKVYWDHVLPKRWQRLKQIKEMKVTHSLLPWES